MTRQKNIHSDPETIRRYCGELDVDVWAGWEAGLLPRKRVYGRVRDRDPPEHLTGDRYVNWIHGYSKARAYREDVMPRREVHFVGKTRGGAEIVVRRKGWSVDRGKVVARMARWGIEGDVKVYYFEASEIVRVVKCGI